MKERTIDEELRIMPLVVKECKRKRWAIDGGANIGAFTASMLEHFEFVCAVEPVQPTFEQLYTRFKDNPSLQLCPQALWHTTGETVYMTHPVNRTKSTAYYATTKEKNSEHAVKTVTIDDLFSQGFSGVDFIKLDLEGAELHALKGATRIIERYKPVILVECVQKQLDRYGHSIGAIDKWLIKRGYQLRKESVANRLYVA